MTLGLAPRQADLFRGTVAFCEGRVAPGSMYGILHRECFRLFPDEMFADLFEDVGRWSACTSRAACSGSAGLAGHGDERSSPVDRGDQPALAEYLHGSADGAVGDFVVLGQVPFGA
jgi:hypothetical protein